MNEIINNDGKCFQVTAELTKPEFCKESIEKVMNQFGAIHGLVNNAGVNNGVGLKHGDHESFISSLHKNLFIIICSRIMLCLH